MKPTAYKIGEGERKGLSKDMQEVILAYEEENRNLKSELSKFRDSFKKYRDYEKEELAESCYDFARENDKLKEENKKLKVELEYYKKQYKHTMGDYIEEDLYDLDC